MRNVEKSQENMPKTNTHSGRWDMERANHGVRPRHGEQYIHVDEKKWSTALNHHGFFFLSLCSARIMTPPDPFGHAVYVKCRGHSYPLSRKKTTYRYKDAHRHSRYRPPPSSPLVCHEALNLPYQPKVSLVGLLIQRHPLNIRYLVR